MGRARDGGIPRVQRETSGVGAALPHAARLWFRQGWVLLSTPLDFATLLALPAPGPVTEAGGVLLCERRPLRPWFAARLGEAALPGPVGAPARAGAAPPSVAVPRFAATLGAAASPGA